MPTPNDLGDPALPPPGPGKPPPKGPVVGAMPPHQQRVVDEKSELDDKRTKLDAFISGNALFQTLPSDEQKRLTDQYGVMSEYSQILGERIAAFPAPGPDLK